MHATGQAASGAGLSTLAQLASETAHVEQPSPSYTFTVSPLKTHDGKLSFELAPTN
jgi:aspartate-semialdehyde dehydrogenase